MDGKNRVWVAAPDADGAKQRAAKLLDCHPDQVEFKQDEDVLDTWFSSALQPFAVFGWPSKTADLDQYYPLSLMETGHDILFFWVARMVMLGTHLTGKVYTSVETGIFAKFAFFVYFIRIYAKNAKKFPEI